MKINIQKLVTTLTDFLRVIMKKKQKLHKYILFCYNENMLNQLLSYVSFTFEEQDARRKQTKIALKLSVIKI